MTTTLQEAKQQPDHWNITAKLVTKMVFVKRVNGATSMALILVFIDTNGQSFEIKTWSNNKNDRRKKIFTVYRKVDENNFYEIQGSRPGYFFRTPKEEFSTSLLEYSAGWWIDPIDDLRMNRYLDCVTNIQRALSTLNQDRPVNLLGSYVSHRKGPTANVIRGKATIQGYFINLVDDSGHAYVALIWHAVRIDRNKLSLSEAKKGDTVLLYSARLGHPQSDSSGDKVYVTSIYRPVVNSKCVSQKRIGALREGFKSIHEPSSE